MLSWRIVGIVALPAVLFGMGQLIGSLVRKSEAAEVVLASSEERHAIDVGQPMIETERGGKPATRKNRPSRNSFLTDRLDPLIEEWLAADPEAYPELYARTQKLQARMRRLVLPLVRELWIDRDPGGALAAGGDVAKAARVTAGEALGDLIDEDAAAAWETLEGSEGNVEPSEELLRKLALADPERAMKLRHGRFASTILEELAKEDPARALELLKMRPDLSGSVAKGWVENDMEAALAWSETAKGGGKWRRTDDWAELVANANPAIGLPWAQGRGLLLDNENGRALGGRAFAKWVESSREAALTWFHGLANDELRGQLLSRLHLDDSGDPTLAMTLAKEIDPDTHLDPRSVVMEGASRKWMQTDSEAATDWIRNNLGADEANALLADTARSWAKHDPDAGIAWFESLDDDARGEVLATFATSLAGVDADRTVAWLKELPPNEVTVVGARLMDQLPSNAATELLDALPVEHALRDYYVDMLGDEDYRDIEDYLWAARAPETAGDVEFANRLATVLEQRGHDRPNETLAMVEGFEDERLRASAYLGVAKLWVQADLEAGRDVLKEAKLSPESRAEALASLDAFVERRGR